MARSRGYFTENMTDADYADDLLLLINTPPPAEFLLHSQVQEAADIGLYVDTDQKQTYIFE